MASASKLVVLSMLVVAFATSTAEAFCIYNKWSAPISAYALPIDGSSFKKVIAPGSSQCCNWKDQTCFDTATYEVPTGAIDPNYHPETLGQCSEVFFIINQGSDDVKAVSKKIVKDELYTVLKATYEGFAGWRKIVGNLKDALGLVKAINDLSDESTGGIIPKNENPVIVNSVAGGALNYFSDTNIPTVVPSNC